MSEPKEFKAYDLFSREELDEMIADNGLKQIQSVEDISRMAQDYIEATDKSKPFLKRVGSFLRGESDLSRGIGLVLDAVTVFTPRIRTVRSIVQTLITRKRKQPAMKKAIMRALSTDGGSFLAVRNEKGLIDLPAIGAIVIRVALITGAYWLAVQVGAPDPMGLLEMIFGKAVATE